MNPAPPYIDKSRLGMLKVSSRRMPIVLGTFASSSKKFVDLSYYVQSSRDSMKARQRLVAKIARRNAVCYCFLLLSLLFRKIANMRIFHSERSNQENNGKRKMID